MHLLLCFHAIPALRHEIRVQRSLLRPLLAFGSWMTVSNIVSPLMVYLDRFLIGAILSVTAVTYYATPYEVVIRLAVIPSALVAVLFPAFASGIAQGSSRTVLLFGRGMKYVFLAMFLPVFLIVTLAPEGLAVWLGPDFALRSGAVLRWLALGVFANGLARVPFALVQALGRPDLTAKLHLVELVLYVPVLWMLLGAYGIIGAAVAWAVRVAVDLVLLLGIVRRLLPAAAPLVERTCWATGLGVATLTTAALIPSLAMRGVFAAFVAVGFLVTAWTVALDPDERAFLRRRKAARR
ncbi:MAG: oligosaccharide flippase family protein [Gemmatimonadetes bacterium]|nr:oligosaccharide flippase family protein [Gemmatimonadota bacterium]